MLAENRAHSVTSGATSYSLVEGVAPNSSIFGTRENSLTKSFDAFSTSDQIRFAILFLPIILITLQSYFRSSIVEMLAPFSPIGANAIYWSARVALFGGFLFMLFAKSSTRFKRPARPLDAYADERSTRDPLLGLRALACLNVFFGHWFMVVFSPTTPANSNEEYALRTALSFSPWCGVWMFFTLSGYLMSKGFVTGRHSIDREGLKKFYRNRVVRIFPIYFISMFLVAVFVDPTYLDFRNSSAIQSFLEGTFFDQQTGGVIGPLWSVSTEFQFYLLAPLLFLLLSKCFTRITTRICGAVALCVLFATNQILNSETLAGLMVQPHLQAAAAQLGLLPRRHDNRIHSQRIA